MSKQKTVDLAETENEATENLVVEQSELDGISATETPVETEVKNEVVPDVKTVVEKVVDKPAAKIKVNTVATAAVKANKKMGVYKFLSLYPQDIYIETLLKLYYPHSFYTKDEWFDRIQDILNTPINN